ncbi:MAG: hypothetical protein L3J84_03480 [Gammaproteobacteria bacterium]|nr:hypothetical protein [Gammaproteobacteria bacterium]
MYKQLNKSDREYIFPNIENCSRLYTNGELSILEIYCSQDSDGLYIFGENNQTRFDWYDKKFNLWAISEGCNSEDACFYELKVDKNGMVLEFAYHFFINLSEGIYSVKVADKTLKVIEQQIVDQPS